MLGSWKRRLPIATGILIVLITGTEPGRRASNAQTTPARSASPATPGSAASNLSRFDTSGHKIGFVRVAPGVQLEVLDWGGTGETLLLLTGIGENAHVYDDLSYQFTDRFHVIGITRRGFGRSSQPAQGYDVATRARDDIRVLDSLNIREAVFVGHSIAGTELSKIAVVYPDRVKKLVYLDSLDYGWGGYTKLPQPAIPEPTPADLESVERYAAFTARILGVRRPIAGLCYQVRTDSSGRVVAASTPPGISQKIWEGLEQAEYVSVAVGQGTTLAANWRPGCYRLFTVDWHPGSWLGNQPDRS
jgi:pimeloyl-ACP methyl ester carboxylesterase